MPLNQWLLTAFILSCVSGCATPPPASKSQADAGVQCGIERPTGSFIATRVCTTRAERDAAAATQAQSGVMDKDATNKIRSSSGQTD
jgi:hypothetical protein